MVVRVAAFMAKWRRQTLVVEASPLRLAPLARFPHCRGGTDPARQGTVASGTVRLDRSVVETECSGNGTDASTVRADDRRADAGRRPKGDPAAVAQRGRCRASSPRCRRARSSGRGGNTGLLTRHPKVQRPGLGRKSRANAAIADAPRPGVRDRPLPCRIGSSTAVGEPGERCEPEGACLRARPAHPTPLPSQTARRRGTGRIGIPPSRRRVWRGGRPLPGAHSAGRRSPRRGRVGRRRGARVLRGR